MRLTFIYLTPFVADCRRLNVVDADLQALEAALLANPEAGATVGGTGGVRKIRLAIKSSGKGKSGGARVIYAYFSSHAHVYFITMYGKGEQSDLTPAERSACREWVEKLRTALERKRP